MTDLKSNKGLLAACQHIQENPRPEAEPWTQDLIQFLQWVSDAGPEERSSLEFQRRIWDANPVAGVGMGTVPIDKLIADVGFRMWLAAKSFGPFPAKRDERLPEIAALYDELVQRCRERLTKVPHLKIFRILAAFFPDDLTTVAHRGSLDKLVRRMRGSADGRHVAMHVYVRNRLDEVLGPPGDSMRDRVQRLELAWDLYAYSDAPAPGEEQVTKKTDVPGDEQLVPLPAARRRRGLTALSGWFPTVLGVLQEVKDGLTREELLDHLRVLFPAVKDSTRRTMLNILRSELAVIKHLDGQYVLTEQGAAALESSSAAPLGDWLLTRVLGIDHVLKRLDEGSASKLDLVALLQSANPGWTSTFIPSSVIAWLASMAAVRVEGAKVRLDTLGEEWAARIHWAPEALESTGLVSAEVVAGEPLQAQGGAKLELPTLSSINTFIQDAGQPFPKDVVESLHLGLWSPTRRHFAVLAGISGSGKTLLAQTYADALGVRNGDGPARIWVEAVQPGWYDPTALLGYLNPLQKDTFQRTGFLTFLLRASQDLQRPYVAVLDEMNLSHPEQYFAPLLSSMESGAPIRLHSEGDVFDGIPESIPYPKNLGIIGTINIDETTHGLSDKVLDRAFVLEFWDIDLDRYPRWEQTSLSKEQAESLRALLSKLMKALQPARLHFGWRVVDDVNGFMSSGTSAGGLDHAALLDAVVYAKILPKLRGENSPMLVESLQAVIEIAKEFSLKRCQSRVVELQADLARTGSVRFWR